MQNFNMQRVKVYRLNRDGLWDDKGTGHVSMEYMEVYAPAPLRLLPPLSPALKRGLPL